MTEILLGQVDGLSLRTKGGDGKRVEVAVSFKAMMEPEDASSLLELQAANCPMDMVVKCPQLAMPLKVK